MMPSSGYLSRRRRLPGLLLPTNRNRDRRCSHCRRVRLLLHGRCGFGFWHSPHRWYDLFDRRLFRFSLFSTAFVSVAHDFPLTFTVGFLNSARGSGSAVRENRVAHDIVRNHSGKFFLTVSTRNDLPAHVPRSRPVPNLDDLLPVALRTRYGYRNTDAFCWFHRYLRAFRNAS